MSDRKFNDLPNHPRFRERTDLDGMGFILVPEPTHCPKCGSAEIREITYGLPAEPPDEDRYHVGGCVVQAEESHCGNCGHEW